MNLGQLFSLDVTAIDFKQIGLLPAPVRVLLLAVVCGILLALGWWLYLFDCWTEYAHAQQQEAVLKQDYRHKSLATAVPVDGDQQITGKIASLLLSLPLDQRFPELIDDLTEAATASGLSMENIDVGQPVTQSFYSELPIKVKAQGSYHDFGAFMSALLTLPRVITPHDFELQPVADTPGNLLDISVELKAYNYIDQVPAQ